MAEEVPASTAAYDGLREEKQQYAMAAGDEVRRQKRSKKQTAPAPLHARPPQLLVVRCSHTVVTFSVHA
jgi:hypothetical protein